MKKATALRLTLGLILVFLCGTTPLAAKDNWLTVRSKNFHLVGNASEKDLRRTAVKLEQFRDIFTRLFPNLKFTSQVPAVVVVFKDRAAYKPFNPRNSGGYFQPGQDINYITLALVAGDDTPFSTIFHEYVHLLLNTNAARVPTWFNEGLAEYYSTLRVEDDRKIFLGDVIPNHLYRLADTKPLPLRTLLSLDKTSRYYNETDKRGIFYAQSWALVHYLLLADEGRRAPQLNAFVRLLSSGQPTEQAFAQAFQTTPEALEKELAEYVRRSRFPARYYTSDKKLEFDAGLQVTPLSEAATQARLGDLLLHTGDYGAAEARLKQALALEPANTDAQASLGLLRVRQGRLPDAVNALERAAQNSTNYLVYYYYAFALSRAGYNEVQSVGQYAPSNVVEMRRALLRAIELAPQFPESYALLAFVNMVSGTRIDEAARLLEKALSLVPGRADLALNLAQVYLRQQDFVLARRTLEPLAQHPDEPKIRRQAADLLVTLKRLEGIRADGGIIVGGTEVGPRPLPTDNQTELKDVPSPAELLNQAIREALRPVGAGETRIMGKLTKLECDQRGIAYFIVQTPERGFKIRAYNLSTVQLTAFTPQAGQTLGCGVRQTPDHVLLTFRVTTTPTDAKAKVDGDALALELVPADFTLTKQ